MPDKKEKHMNILRRAAAVCALHLILAHVAFGLTVPVRTGRVSDNASIIPPNVKAALEAELEALESGTGVQIAVLTLQSLEGENIDEYALRVLQSWDIGQKGKNNGALLLVAVKEGAIRIEVGRSLDYALPDVTRTVIMQNEIAPAFMAGDYGAGIYDGIESMSRYVNEAYVAEDGILGNKQLLDIIAGIASTTLFIFIAGLFIAYGRLALGLVVCTILGIGLSLVFLPTSAVYLILGGVVGIAGCACVAIVLHIDKEPSGVTKSKINKITAAAIGNLCGSIAGWLIFGYNHLLVLAMGWIGLLLAVLSIFALNESTSEGGEGSGANNNV